MTQAPATPPVLFGYDGTELADRAIREAAAQLATPRDAVVVLVWQPAEVGFTPLGGDHFDADDPSAVRGAAERTVAHGAEIARAAGFTARPLTVQAAPVCDAIVDTAEQVGADLIVVGVRNHGTLATHLLGHIAPKLLSRSSVALLAVHEQA